MPRSLCALCAYEIEDLSFTVSQEEWIEHKRKDRNLEFAPPMTQNMNRHTEKPDISTAENNANVDNINPNECLKSKPGNISATFLYNDFNLDDIPLPEVPSSSSIVNTDAYPVASAAEKTEHQVQHTDILLETLKSNPDKVAASNQNEHATENMSRSSIADTAEFQKGLSEALFHFRNNS